MRLLRMGAVPLLVLPVAWILFQGLGRDPRAIASPLIGRPAPSFSAASMSGEVVDLEAYRGRPIIVNFWASWCFECIAEHAVLLRAQEQYDELVILGVLYQDTVRDAGSFLARYGDGGWPNLIDPDGRISIDYGVTGVPESFFIDRSGLVRYKQYGAVTGAVLADQLPSLMSQASDASPQPSRP
ncbi:MAG: redoxin domain-containing protein [Chloroflexi bacterium]|nr:redoxin domain-containing protein [Chloroflexota bacterium]